MLMNPAEEFNRKVAANILALSTNQEAISLSRAWSRETNRNGYTYNYQWLGRPIIQYPQDIVAIQELVWRIKPDLVIETGIAHGGSLVLSASMLALLDLCDAAQEGSMVDPAISRRIVLGVDIDIRPHNRSGIESHPLSSRIKMIEGSSIEDNVIQQVTEMAAGYASTLVFLDSNHTHDHVLAELEAYAPLVTSGSYCVVFDTLIDDMPSDMFPDRPWGPKNNPKTAVHEYLKRLALEGRRAADGEPLQFEIDKQMDAKLQISVAPEGYLRRV